MKSHSSPRLIPEEAFQSLLTTDPIYAAAATVAVDMGFWKIEKNAIPEGKGVGHISQQRVHRKHP